MQLSHLVIIKWKFQFEIRVGQTLVVRSMTEAELQANETFKNSLSHSPAERLRSGSLDEHKEGRFCDGVYEHADWNVSEKTDVIVFFQHGLNESGNTRVISEICSKLIIKTLERR